MHWYLESKLTVASVLRFFRKLWIVAVLEVPDSPTRSTGLLIFTICSRTQLVRVVSIVGTWANIEVKGIKVKKASYDVKNTLDWISPVHTQDIWIFFCPKVHINELYLEYQQTSSQVCGCIWRPVNSKEPTSQELHQNGTHRGLGGILDGWRHKGNIMKFWE